MLNMVKQRGRNKMFERNNEHEIQKRQKERSDLKYA